MSPAYTELLHGLKEVATLTSTTALLGWDQETMMPAKAGAARAEQLALFCLERPFGQGLRNSLGHAEIDNLRGRLILMD